MSEFKDKPLNPNSQVIPGRLSGLLFFISKQFGNVDPNFNALIIEENREAGHIVVKNRQGKRVVCLVNSMFRNGWSLMRKAGTYKQDDIIVMMCMSAREENDSTPRRLITFRPSDVQTQVIQTKIGEREASFFSLDKQDEWDQFSCELTNLGRGIRSIFENSVDPDIPAGPFKSTLHSMLEGTPAPTGGNTDGDSGAGDWDDDVPF